MKREYSEEKKRGGGHLEGVKRKERGRRQGEGREEGGKRGGEIGRRE
jgi:hypothetical protein